MHIFLSYSSVDRDLANRVHLSLIALEHDVFFDREGLTAGLEYDNRIAKEIRRADLFIFLILNRSAPDGTRLMKWVSRNGDGSILAGTCSPS